MKANYNVTGQKRKELVAVISRITGEKAAYQFMPTCAYQIGELTVTKEGTLVSENNEMLRTVVTALAAEGFEAESTAETTESGESMEKTEKCETAQTIDQAEEQENEDQNDAANEVQESTEEPIPAENPADDFRIADSVTISIPRSTLDDHQLENLKNLLSAKHSLICRALAVDDLPVEADEEKISFPWFKGAVETELANAAVEFIGKLADLAKNQKRVNATEHPADNEKYAFRCFLLRLGFIGGEYKTTRKILLKNLTGNSSWKNGTPHTDAEQEAASC